MSGMALSPEPIEAYLDELVRASADLSPRQLRHLLSETEAHLRDDADALITGGTAEADAEAQAVLRFGPVRDLVAAERSRRTTPPAVIFGQVATSALLLGGIGAVAVGASGLVAAVIRAIGGTGVLVSVSPGQALSPADCARWLAGDPGAVSCRQAALADWAAETVYYRIALGVVGVVALLVYRRLQRRHRGARHPLLLPATVRDTMGATLFAAAGVWTLGMGIDAITVSSGQGSGQWLSAAPVALLAAGAFGWRLLRDLREPVSAT